MGSVNGLILASASPRRSELLRSIGVEFAIVPGSAIELHDEQLSARELCEENARRKAREIAAKNPAAVVLGADTLVARGGRIYGKPRDLAEARLMLRELSGKNHEVVTGLCLVQMSTGRELVFHDVTFVTFRELTDETISQYIAEVPVLDKAGAYAIQDHGEMLVQEISGSFSNVVGLPLERLMTELDRWQIPYNLRKR